MVGDDPRLDSIPNLIISSGDQQSTVGMHSIKHNFHIEFIQVFSPLLPSGLPIINILRLRFDNFLFIFGFDWFGVIFFSESILGNSRINLFFLKLDLFLISFLYSRIVYNGIFVIRFIELV